MGRCERAGQRLQEALCSKSAMVAYVDGVGLFGCEQQAALVAGARLSRVSRPRRGPACRRARRVSGRLGRGLGWRV